MNRFARDPGLNELAAKLKTLEWIEPLESCEWEDLYRVASLATHELGAKRRCVCPLPNYSDWAVRLYLGGDHRTLGIVKSQELPNALRFADMAQMHFWKYRVRGAAPPTCYQLNRDPKDVERDMVIEANAVLLLQQMEKYLLETGALQTAEQRRAARKERKLRSIRVLQEVHHLEIQEDFQHTLGFLSKNEQLHGEAAKERQVFYTEVKDRLSALEKLLADIKGVQQLQVEALQGIARMVASKQTT